MELEGTHWSQKVCRYVALRFAGQIQLVFGMWWFCQPGLLSHSIHFWEKILYVHQGGGYVIRSVCLSFCPFVCQQDNPPPTLPSVGHIWDVMWCWSGGTWILTELSLCYSIVYYYNGAQRYEQFLQVGRLYRALILLGLALCLPSAAVSSVLMVL